MDIQNQSFILQLEHLDKIMTFEKARLENQISDPMEREMASWTAKWRQESLEHYLPQGWSFGVEREGKLTGYFLAQPLVFFGGMTQTLWVEHLSYSSEQDASLLIDLAYRWSRDKHLQKVLLAEGDQLQSLLEPYGAEKFSEQDIFQIKTAKFK